MTTNLNDDLSEHYYLAGPMSGIAEHNFPEFERMAKELRTRLAFKIVSPAEITLADTEPPGTHPWEHYLKEDLAFVIRCKGIILMPGWQQSRGARVELYVAHALNLEVYYIDGDLRVTRSSEYGRKPWS